MVRFVALAFVALLIFLIVRSVVSSVLAGFRGTTRPGGGRRALRDHLVKDPVCETYVPRRSAIVRAVGSATYYFCSPVCAEKFEVRS